MRRLRQILCWLATGHAAWREKTYRDLLTGHPYLGRECRQCGRRVL